MKVALLRMVACVVTKSSAVSVSSLPALATRESVAISPSGLPVLKVKESAKAGVAVKIAILIAARKLTITRLFILILLCRIVNLDFVYGGKTTGSPDNPGA